MKEASQKGRILCSSIYIKCPEQANPRNESILVIARKGWEGGEWTVTANRVSFEIEENVLKSDNGNSCDSKNTMNFAL